MPFALAFYEALDLQALSSAQIAAHPDRRQLSRRPLSAHRTEDLLIWLIQLGVLRREVDGQGLTERVRLTPLGRVVLSDWPGEIPSASLPTRLRHWIKQHWPRL